MYDLKINHFQTENYPYYQDICTDINVVCFSYPIHILQK